MFSFKKYFTDRKLYTHLLILLLGYKGKLRGLIRAEKKITQNILKKCMEVRKVSHAFFKLKLLGSVFNSKGILKTIHQSHSSQDVK